MAYLFINVDGLVEPLVYPTRLHQLGQVRGREGADEVRTEMVPTPPADPVQVDENFAEALGLTDHRSTSLLGD